MNVFFLSLLSVLPSSASTTEHHRLRFLAIGDWGGTDDHPYYSEDQWATAQGLASVAAATPVDNTPAASFMVSLGDNFYGDGLSTTSEESHSLRFHGTFESVYHHQELQVPWYIIGGNHDYRGNITAQLQYGQNPNTRWVYPDFNHRAVKEFTVDNDDGSASSVKLEIILIDTVQLAPEPCWECHETLAGIPGGDRATVILEWIKSALHESDADYLLVAGHQPIYSPCSHGNTDSLITSLDPLLKEYNVSAYLSGHEHCQFHFAHEGMDYFTSGTGHSCCYGASNQIHLPQGGELEYLLVDSEDSSGSSGVRGGFLSFDVGSDVMNVAVHDEDGASLYNAAVLPRHTAKVKAATTKEAYVAVE